MERTMHKHLVLVLVVRVLITMLHVEVFDSCERGIMRPVWRGTQLRRLKGLGP